jgi:23S rRNA (uracil1939-C5)-methyltransferase
MVSVGDEVALTIDKPAAGGRMIARLDGQVVLVAGAVPGERVVARVERIVKRLAFADVVRVDEASPDRRAAFVDPLCGGCAYSHIAYARQLEIKAQVIADAFARIGRLPLASAPRVAASPEAGYRMRARLHVRDRRLGFFREGSHEVCDPRPTRQLLSETCDALDRLMASIRSVGARVGDVELSENVAATERVVHLDAPEGIDPRTLDRLAGVEGLTPGPYVTDVVHVGDRPLTFRRHVLAFFQGNRYLLRDLVADVVDRVPLGATVVDLYAGAGLFSIAAAVVRGANVVAVERDPHAADDLAANVSTAGVQITTMRMPVERVGAWFSTARRAVGAAPPPPLTETVIADPPRTGMSPEALDATLRLRARRIVYVSCDPATLARDARKIVDAGYAIDRVDAFDLFPNTPPVETVVVFDKSE